MAREENDIGWGSRAVRDGNTVAASARHSSTRWTSTGVGDIFESEMGRRKEKTGLLGRLRAGSESGVRTDGHPLLSIIVYLFIVKINKADFFFQGNYLTTSLVLNYKSL